jgi:hypothetical protein
MMSGARTVGEDQPDEEPEVTAKMRRTSETGNGQYERCCWVRGIEESYL